jgi:murein DD-endopeptidase MepM/ murein hydrolase activator NlpD
MNIKESRCGIVRAVTIVTMAGLVGACADQFAPAPVFNKGIAPMAATPAPLPPRQITVQRGQTLDGIAHANHVPAAAIVAANKLKPPYELKTGARLLIPNAGPPPTQQAMAPSASAGSVPVQQQAMAPSAGAAAVSPPIPLPPPQPVSLTPPPATAAVAQAQAVAASPPSPLPQPPQAQAAVTPLPPTPQPVTPSASAAKNNPDIIPLDGPPPKQTGATPVLTPPQPTPTPAPQPSAVAGSSGPPPVMPPRNAAAALPLPGEAVAQQATADTSSGRFPWPVRGRVLASYGNTAGGGHNDGINIAAPRGTPVRSIDAGTVAYAGNEVKGYGNLVLIRHENGWISAYAHLDDVTVKPGDRIAAGQPFAKVGDSGGVAEPQLHFELRRGKKPVDPREFLGPAPSAAGLGGNKAG